MCVSPSWVWIENGPKLDGSMAYKKQKVQCGKCYACNKNKIWDLTGRILMERAMADWAVCLTLTYDDKRIIDYTQTTQLHLDDMRAFLDRIKYYFPNFRYVAAGEYGKLRGRTHWHVLLMGLGKRPDIPNNRKQRFHWKPWPWGHVTAEHGADEKSIRYIVKYLWKAQADKVERKEGKGYRSEWFGYSKNPLLGFEYIQELARKQAEARVFPRDFNYRPPGGHPSKWRYTLQGTAQDVFFDELVRCWPEALESPHKTEWMENAVRRYLRKKHRRAWDAYVKDCRNSYAGHCVLFWGDMPRRGFPRKELTKADKIIQDWYQENARVVEAEKRDVQIWLEEREAVRRGMKDISVSQRHRGLHVRPIDLEPPRL
jgi:hypothetical protein